MYRIHLTEPQRQELQQRAHQKSVAPRTRDRLEMIRLSDKGWSVPKIAVHLDLHEQTVRSWINSSFTFREYDYLNNARQTPKLPDWAVVDITSPPTSRTPGKIVAADFFGEHWELIKSSASSTARR